MPGEQVILKTASVERDLTSSLAGYWLLEHAYPTPEDEDQWAAAADTEGERRASTRPRNRTITVKVRCREPAGGSPEIGAIVQDLQATIAELHRTGGTLKRVLPSGDAITFDVISARIQVPAEQAWVSRRRADVELQLTCRPYGRGAEITLGSNAETTLPSLIITKTGIPGDVPGLGRLEIESDVTFGVVQKWMIWGLESHHLAGGADLANEPLLIQAENATFIIPQSGAATAVGPAGASGAGSNVLRQTALTTSWLSQLVSERRSVGTFRMFARVWVPTSNTGTVQVRLVWAAGAQSPPAINRAVTLDPAWEGSWRLVDLGIVTAPHARFQLPGSGTRLGSWRFSLGATSSVTNDDLDIDYVMLVPVAEGSGVLTDIDGIWSLGGNGDVVLDHQSIVRWGPSGVGAGGSIDYGDPTRYEGDYLLVPPAGPEGRTLRLIIKFSRNDIATGADSDIDDISARLFVTPRYLVVPDPAP